MYRLIKLLMISGDQQAPFPVRLSEISGQLGDTLLLSLIHTLLPGDDEVVVDHSFHQNVGNTSIHFFKKSGAQSKS
jgi:hypothetical protein